MEITISLPDRDAERIARLGAIPWSKITDEEKREYQALLESCGSRVALKILNVPA